MKKKRLKITPILVTLNIIVIITIISFYLIRMYKFYVKDNIVSDISNEVSLYDYLVSKQSYVDMTSGLVYDEKTNIFRYKGKIDNNYVYYNGILYRIVLIDNENNIKLITEENVTELYANLNKGFSASSLNKWLNKSDEENSGIFESSLYDSSLLVNTYNCNDIVNDLSKITCDEYTNDYKINTLSLYDYAQSGGKEGYLNNGNIFFTNSISDKGVYFINSSGEVGIDNLSKIHGVRSVISIDGNSIILNGDGSKDNPFIIEKHDISTVRDIYIGSYISIDENSYRVVGKNEDCVKVVLNGVLKDSDGKEITKTFGGSNNTYSLNKNTIGYYLNNDYASSLNIDLVESKWFIGSYSSSNTDYALKYNKSIDAKVGMLSIGDLFISEIGNVLTISSSSESSMTINVISSSKTVFKDLVASEYNIRPSFCISNDLVVSGGNGTNEDNYVVEVKEESNEEEN